MLEKSQRKEKEDMPKVTANEHPEEKLNTEDKDVSLETVIKELPQLLVNHAYKKLKSGEDLTASEMKVCLDVCKAYSKEPITKKEHNILDEVPFDDGQKN